MNCLFVDLGKHYGGAENYLTNVIERWVQLGNNAFVIVRKGYLFSEKLMSSNLGITVLEASFSLKSVCEVRKKLSDESIDVVNINGINSGFFFNFLRVNKPRVTTVHSNADMDRADRNVLVRKLFVFLENNNLAKSGKIIAVSEAIKEILIQRKIPAERIVVINNGIQAIDYKTKRTRKEREKLRVCYVGRLEEVKGCRYLIEAISNIKGSVGCCDVYGEGTLEKELKNLSKQLEVDEVVNFKGFSDNIREILIDYDVLVLPSLYEAFPLVIPEAMNSRTLLICSNVGGIPWIIKDGINGYLFEKKNSNQLADIIYKIFLDDQVNKMIVDNAYVEFIEKYTLDTMIEKTFEVFKYAS